MCGFCEDVRMRVLPVGGGPAVVECDGLTRVYGPGQVVGPVSLTLAPGEGMALTGSNGAGKSTLLRLVRGEERADEGAVRILGEPPRSADPGFRRRVLVLDEVSYFPDL